MEKTTKQIIRKMIYEVILHIEKQITDECPEAGAAALVALQGAANGDAAALESVQAAIPDSANNTTIEEVLRYATHPNPLFALLMSSRYARMAAGQKAYWDAFEKNACTLTTEEDGVDAELAWQTDMLEQTIGARVKSQKWNSFFDVAKKACGTDECWDSLAE